MDFERVDPELREALPRMHVLDMNNVVDARKAMQTMLDNVAPSSGPAVQRVRHHDVEVPGMDTDPPVPVRLYEPVESS